MNTFKLGDLVVRTSKGFPEYGIVEGDVYTVLDIKDSEDDEFADIQLKEDPERWYDKRNFKLYIPEPTELTEAYAKIESLESALEDAVRELISLREGNNTAVIAVNDNVFKLTEDGLQFKPIYEMTLDDWELAKEEGWVFETREGEEVTIRRIVDFEDNNRPICDSNGYYHNLNGMWNDTVGEDSDDIIKRIK